MSFLLCLPLRRLIIVLLSFVLIVILEALLLREPGRKCGMVGNHDPRTDLRDYAKKLPLYFLPTLLVSRHNGLFLAIPCAVFSRLNHLDWKWKVRKNEYNESLCIKIWPIFLLCICNKSIWTRKRNWIVRKNAWKDADEVK